jgi:hypothetical protein
MDIFDIQPQISEARFGSEPSIRMLLREYYGKHFPANETERLVEEYIAKHKIATA